MTDTARPGLVRALSRWDLTALVINSILGSGIFGLPATIIVLLHGASPLAYLVAGAGIAVVVVCFAEVSSRFTQAGGPYLYAREAFGPFVGLQIGWIAWLVRVTSAGANANLFALYLAELWPPAGSPGGRALVLTLLILVLTYVNYRGVKQGAWASDALALAKLLPLAFFVLAGLFFVRTEVFSLTTTASWKEWSQAILLLVFAFGGFEASLLPAGEARDPKRDFPVALLMGLAVITVFYLSIHVVVQGTLPPGTETERPLAAAAREFLGTPGGTLMALAAMLSVYGYFSGALLSAPRLTFALGERGDFPSFFAAVHPRYHTPHVSLWFFAALTWGLALYGSFQWNAMLSAVARLLTYATICAALLVFRRREAAPTAFIAPAGTLLALLGIGFSLVLLAQMGLGELVILAVTVALAALTWLWARRRPG
ncbi:MAG: amino acid permease [Acidobacteria bacterium]|nr:amino acid permease [Acidobacteriota bacterium]